MKSQLLFKNVPISKVFDEVRDLKLPECEFGSGFEFGSESDFGSGFRSGSRCEFGSGFGFESEPGFENMRANEKDAIEKDEG